MKTRAHLRSFVWVGVLALGLAAPAVGLAGEKFSLVSAVPDDVFFCVANQHNPERKFINEYWGEVLEVVKQADLGADAMKLIGAVGGEEGQAEAEELKQMGTELFNAVDWGKLAAQEFIFAMRMPRAIIQKDDISVGGMDEVFLFRGEAGSGAQNFAGLVKIAETLLAKLNEAAGSQFTLERTEQAGANVAVVKFIKMGTNEYSLSVAQRGDVIALILGGSFRDEVLGLLDGQKTAKPLSACPRFKQAFAGLPAAEDEVSFFDMQRMLTDIRAITDPIFAAQAAEAAQAPPAGSMAPVDEYLNRGQSSEANTLVQQSVEAHGRQDYQTALSLIEQAYKINPADSIVMYNLACYNALLGNKDEAISWLEKAVDGGFHAPGKISEDSDLDSLRDDPRYKTILAQATELAPKGEAPDKAKEEQWVGVVKVILDRIMSSAGMMDYTASVGYTDGYTTREDSVVVLAPGAKEQPLFPVFGKRKPQTDFAKYLPKETVSFSVSGGIDWGELYNFLEDTVRMIGPDGEMALEQWAAMQQQIGFDVRKDLLSWLQGDTVSAKLRLSSGDAWVGMIKVTDEDAAREKVTAGINKLSELMAQLATQNPMMGMLAIRTAPCTNEKLTGFQNIMMGMSPQPMVCGVADGYIIFAGTEQAAALCLATAAGEHPNVTKNEQVMSEALVPTGAFNCVSFEDMRRLGTEIAQVLGVINMVGGMASMAIPDPEIQKVLPQIFAMIGKLVPAAQKIDFYKSSASYTTFDGKAWYTRKQTSYVSPEERSAAATASAGEQAM